jgi:predicted RNase H-like HicB family nuclease
VPGLVTEGSTPEEITRNVQEVLEVLMLGWKKHGLEIPLGGKDLSPGTVRAIIRELGISREDFGPIK